MRGQLSLEMLIVIVVVLGLAVLLASTMMKSAGKTADKITEKTDSVLNTSDAAGKGAAGDYCTSDSGCLSNNCGLDSKCL
ncbi:MAG: hypothetical protein QW568_02650 [Candidatus Anstonellaceae archaeon]